MPIDPLPTAPDRNDPNTFRPRANAFVAALATFVTQANALAVTMAGYLTDAIAYAAAALSSANNAASSASAAAASALSAVNAPGTSGTSTTSLTVGTGSKTATTQTGKAWVVGQTVVIARTSAPDSTRMSGVITAYNSGTGSITVNVDAILGTGTHTDWTISLATASAPAALPIQPISGNTSATAGIHYKFTAALALTLPASPSNGQVVQFTDKSGTTTSTVDPGTKSIRGASGVMTLDMPNASALLVYDAANNDWV